VASWLAGWAEFLSRSACLSVLLYVASYTKPFLVLATTICGGVAIYVHVRRRAHSCPPRPIGYRITDSAASCSENVHLLSPVAIVTSPIFAIRQRLRCRWRTFSADQKLVVGQLLRYQELGEERDASAVRRAQLFLSEEESIFYFLIFFFPVFFLTPPFFAATTGATIWFLLWYASKY
jgi:hypothetical protein